MRQFTQCLDCKRPLVTMQTADGKPHRAQSKYPYCISCYTKRGDDPEFQKWIVALLARRGLKIV